MLKTTPFFFLFLITAANANAQAPSLEASSAVDRKVEFRISAKTGPSLFFRGRDYACKRATNELHDLILNDVECMIQAKKKYASSQPNGDVTVDPATVRVHKESVSCGCTLAPAGNNCWSCVAFGAVRCELTLIEASAQ
jgi:hypothetical protein